MQAITTDGVAWSVCPSVCMSRSSAHCKNDWTNRDVLDVDSAGSKETSIRWWSRYPRVKEQFWGGGEKRGEEGAGACPAVNILKGSKRLNRGQNWYGADADSGVLDGLHIGATWRIRLNRPSAAAMRLDVRPHRRRTCTVQSYSPGCANVHPI